MREDNQIYTLLKSRPAQWWRHTKALWADFLEIWATEWEDFLLIWTRELAVGLFLVMCFAAAIGIYAPRTVGMSRPGSDSPDALMVYMQHTNEQQINLLSDRVKVLESEMLVQVGKTSALESQNEDSTWFRRLVLGGIFTVIVGVAGVFAKIRMGGSRR